MPAINTAEQPADPRAARSRPADPVVTDAERGAVVAPENQQQPKARRHDRRQARAPPAHADLFSIREFCLRNCITRQFFYELRKRGLGPDLIRLGTRVLISREAAARWRAERERATKADAPEAAA